MPTHLQLQSKDLAQALQSVLQLCCDRLSKLRTVVWKSVGLTLLACLLCHMFRLASLRLAATSMH